MITTVVILALLTGVKFPDTHRLDDFIIQEHCVMNSSICSINKKVIPAGSRDRPTWFISKAL